MRDQNAKGWQQLDFKTIKRFYLTDSSGSNIHNGVQFSDQYSRGPYSSDHFEHSKFFSIKKVYPIAFSNDIHTTVNTANCLGAKHFSSMEQLYFTPANTGAYEILILCYAHSQLHIKNGQISVSRS